MTDSIQFVFACLSTHSKGVKKIRADVSSLNDFFSLSAADQSVIQAYLSKNGQQVLTTAILSEEKRWRELLPSIHYTVKWFSAETLKKTWQLYLEDLRLTEPLPSTPLWESLRFLNFLLQKDLDRLEKEIIEYEILRNTTALYNFPAENLSAQINPSFRSKKFQHSISKVLASLQGDYLMEKEACYSAETIGFYKLLSTGSVKTIKLKQEFACFLNQLSC